MLLLENVFKDAVKMSTRQPGFRFPLRLLVMKSLKAIGKTVEEFCACIRWFLFVKLFMAGWQVVVRSLPSVVSMKLIMPPFLKRFYQRNGVSNEWSRSSCRDSNYPFLKK